MTTLMLIALLAWLPLSLLVAVVAGKSIRFGTGEPERTPPSRKRAAGTGRAAAMLR